MIPAFAPASLVGVGDGSLYMAIQILGLTSGLQLCLDAGDGASYDGSSQTWLDRSGNGYNFYRGASSSSESSDPAFNGSSGHLSGSEYFSYDGGDYFTLGQSNPTWIEGMHKAGAKFTLAELFYANAIDNASSDFVGDVATCGDSTPTTGIIFGSSISILRSFAIAVYNGSTEVYVKRTSATFANNSWNFVALSVDISNGSVIFQINNTTETYTGQSYSSPSSGSSAGPMKLGAFPPSGTFPDKSGTRLALVAGWNTALTGTQLAGLYNSTKSRFGL